MRKMAAILTLALLLSVVQSAYGWDFSESRVAGADAVQMNPEIYGSLIVWEDYRNDERGVYLGIGLGNPDIYAYNLSTHKEIPICTQVSGDGLRNSAQQNPDVWGNYVVWEDWRNGNADIYIYDLSDPAQPANGTRLTFDIKNQVKPRIWGNYVVWIDYRNGLDGDIYGFNLSTDSNGNGIPDWKEDDFDESIAEKAIFPICTNIFEQMDVDIYGNIVVWKDYRNDTGNGNRDIYGYDIREGREIEICTERHNQFQPAIYGDTVVWVDTRTGTPSIRGKNLSSGEEYDFSDGNTQRYPAIWGNTVVWVETSGTVDYLKMSNLSGKSSVPVGNEWNQRFPSISSTGLVWSDGRDVKHDQYGRELTMWNIYFLRLSNLPPRIGTVTFHPTEIKGGGRSNITIDVRIFDPEGDNISAYALSPVFGNITLFDDGLHGDGMAGDGIYGNYVDVKAFDTFNMKIVAEDSYGAKSSTSIQVPVKKTPNPFYILMGALAVIVVFLLLIAFVYFIRKKTSEELEKGEEK